MTDALNRPAEIAAFAEAVTSHGNVRVSLRDLWRLWAASAPRLIGHPAQAAALAAALADLADRDLIELPRTAWDTSTTPPLPRSITVPKSRRPGSVRRWTQFPWCTELGWAASLPSLSDARFNDLVAINDWLVRTRGTRLPVLPMRYRSVQLFGDEKHLEAMARTSLFGPDRLTLETLACVRIPPPLAAATVGAGPDVLVIENSDTYWTAVHTLRHQITHTIGIVAWGAGRAFPSQVPTLTVDIAGRGPVTGTVWYWGDMDPDGLAIASGAAAVGTIPILPARALWVAMAERPVQSPGTIDWTATPGREWLGPELWTQLAEIRSASGRVAQEAVPSTVIAEWAAAT
ncbi:DUF2220 domain-containing protein [Spirillospora sp. NBC_00431]